ncbi:golgin subfamily A member 1-like isoform X1 [Planococcus citri]|uniref:golgin subfamily A member 1-like isoform X1 n=1 Tax=Planococcus citri TaxID=170843 RepID=UPI0031F8C6FA
MFNNMKNKIREKTGTELPKFTASSASLFGKKSNQHSRQSSQGSIYSVVSDSDAKEENEPKAAAAAALHSAVAKTALSDDVKTTEDDESKVDDTAAAAAAKESEWLEREKQYVSDLSKQTKELQEALSIVTEQKTKLEHFREEKEQLEAYQKQEVAKIKQLLLEKEEENDRNLSALKEALASIESLKLEVDRLRPLEERMNTCQDDLECLRHTSEKERWNLTSQLAQRDEVVRRLEERISVLTHRTEADCQALGAQLSADERVGSLIAERALLERRLEEAHIHLSEIKTSWSNKIATLETQVGRLSRQAGEEGVERRNAEKKITQLECKLDELAKEKENLNGKLVKLVKERDNLACELKELSAVNVTNDEEEEEKEEVRERELERFRELTDRLEVLMKENEALRLSNEESRRIFDESLSKESNKNSALDVEMGRLKEYSVELAVALQKEKDVKDQTLLRNAEISQLVQLTEQELKQQQIQNEESFKKIASLEEQLEITRQNLKTIQMEGNTIAITNEQKLSEKIKQLENEIADKNKSIRILQQNLNDVKKTFQDELKNNPPVAVASSATATATATGIANASANNCSDFLNHDLDGIEDDINFKYMKHVLIKFLTSSEYEAQQLTKAVATLLKLNSEEERLIKDTLEWRCSWFGSKPRVKLHYNPS